MSGWIAPFLEAQAAELGAAENTLLGYGRDLADAETWLAGQGRDFPTAARADIVVFDIPLLFETGGEARMDAVAVVSVDPEIQEERVMARGTMTRAQFRQILSRQMPDAEKRARADYVIVTDTMEHARQQVRAIVADIRSRKAHA